MTSTERWHRWNERRKAEGKPRAFKARDNRLYSQRYYAKRISEGLCPKCGEKRDTELTLCTECRHLWQLKNAERREKAKAPGGHGSLNWKHLEASQARCGVCSLLLPHANCLGGSAEDRPGAGRTYPEGGI